jgi:hypothetical protein
MAIHGFIFITYHCLEEAKWNSKGNTNCCGLRLSSNAELLSTVVSSWEISWLKDHIDSPPQAEEIGKFNITWGGLHGVSYPRHDGREAELRCAA